MERAAPSTTRALLQAFWVTLPLVVVGVSMYALLATRPRSGWTDVPLHPNAVATIVFGRPAQGLAGIDKLPPYNLLAFSKGWSQAQRLSRFADSLFGTHEGLRARSAQWLMSPNGQAGYVEVLEMEGDSLAPEAWLAQTPDRSYLLRPAGNGTVAEPQRGTWPHLLFWRQYIICSQNPAHLEELIGQPLSMQIERQVPAEVAYGLVLHADRWGLEGQETGLLPFYPLGRLAGEARTLVLLPTKASTEGWTFAGLAARSLKRLRWPALLPVAPSRNQTALPDGWQVRIGQGLAGNRFMIGSEDTLAPFRKAVAEQLLGVRLALPPAGPGGHKPLGLALSSAKPDDLRTALQSRFGKAGSHKLVGNVPRAVLGLDLPGFDTCYLAESAGQVYLTAQPLPPDASIPAERLSAGQDMLLQFSPAAQWSYIQAYGPRPLQALQQSLPITFSRLRQVAISLIGDGVQIEVALHPQPLLAEQRLSAKPTFSNLFNAPLAAFGPVAGNPKPMGYALSQLGRLYFFSPGKLSFAQYQLGGIALATPPSYNPTDHTLRWQAQQMAYALDTLGKLLPGYPKHIEDQAVPQRSFQATGPRGQAWRVSLSADGLLEVFAEGGRRYLAKQLYQPERGVRFSVAEAGGQALGLMRYASASATFYDLLGRKRWEVPRPDSLTFFATAQGELGYQALAYGDTVRAYNAIGQPAWVLPTAQGKRPQVFANAKGQTLIAIPDGRYLRWHKLGQ